MFETAKRPESTQKHRQEQYRTNIHTEDLYKTPQKENSSIMISRKEIKGKTAWYERITHNISKRENGPQKVSSLTIHDK
jgi:hypothetical protein